MTAAQALDAANGAAAGERLRRYELAVEKGQTLRVTPAMEAGVSDHIWSIEEIVGLLAS